MSKKVARLAATVDSSDEEYATGAAATGTAATAAQAKRKKLPFDKKRVLLAVLGREAPGVRGPKEEAAIGCAQRMPSFFPPEVKQSWIDWAARTPGTLAEVPEEQRLRQCCMPQKCLPAGSSAAVEAPRVQRELITYSNSDGRSIGKAALTRDADAQKPLYEHDVKIGKTVAIRREPIDPTNKDPGGYNTLFYLGDVRAVNFVADSDAVIVRPPNGAASSSQAAAAPPRRIQSLQLHFRMPLFRNKFNDDVQKPWELACQGLHPWSKACRAKWCLHGAKLANVDSSDATDPPAQPPPAETAMLHVAEAGELMEADVTLNKGHQISKDSRERLAEHGPADGSWRSLLGLPAKASAQKKPSKRVRR